MFLCLVIYGFFGRVFVSFHHANSTRQLSLSITFFSLSRESSRSVLDDFSLASVSIFSLWAWPLLWVNQQALTRPTLPFLLLNTHAALSNYITVGSCSIGALLHDLWLTHSLSDWQAWPATHPSPSWTWRIIWSALRPMTTSSFHKNMR